MEKYYVFKLLVFEVTRKCTQQCNHCLRGHMENIEMTRDIVDNFFNQIPDNSFIDNLCFTGGEPLLNINIIDYICEKIIDRGINIRAFGLFTNGMVFDEKIKKTLLKLYDISLYKNLCTLQISNDQFHKEVDPNNLKEFK